MTTKYYLKIADLTLCISGNLTSKDIEGLIGFQNFTHHNVKEVDINIEFDNIVDIDNIIISDLLYSYRVANLRHLLSYSDNKYYFELYDEILQESVMLSFNPETNSVIVEECKDNNKLRFMLWVAFSLAALGKGVIPIHASAIKHNDNGVLFLGESGTGKSTQSKHWINHIDNVELINDDSPILRFVDGELRVYGSPWSGKTMCYKDICCPVKALIRINRSGSISINRNNTLQAISTLYPSFPPMFAYDETFVDKVFEVMSQIIQQTPIYTLNCTIDPASALISHSVIFL